MKEILGGVTAPEGFLAAGVHAGIKKSKKDVAVIFSEKPAVGAAVFTTNKVKAAPILLSMENIKDQLISAIVVNSGNANACTGEEGMLAARQMLDETGKCLNIPISQVLVASTGVIGVPLPVNKVLTGIRMACQALTKEGSGATAEAIMTTDTVLKEIAVEFEVDGKTVKVGGIAKGSGMIHPNMATMLAFITSDIGIEKELLQETLREIVDQSFNMISVDGDSSTNDMVAVLANGLSGVWVKNKEEEAYLQFKKALEYVALYLAKAIARDGEGATRLIEVRVVNAESLSKARKIARTVTSSNLFKAAVFGEDANWGRIITAVGYAGEEVLVEKIDIYLGKVKVLQKGIPLPFSEEEAREELARETVTVTIDLNEGDNKAVAWGCDLTYDYVKINASYRT